MLSYGTPTDLNFLTEAEANLLITSAAKDDYEEHQALNKLTYCYDAEVLPAAGQERDFQGMSMLWLLAYLRSNEHQNYSQSVRAVWDKLWNKIKYTIRLSSLLKAPSQGPNKEISILFLLALEAANGDPRPWNEAWNVFEYQITEKTLTSSLNRGPTAGISILWCLACHAAHRCAEPFKAVWRRHKQEFTLENFLVKPVSKKHSVMNYLSILIFREPAFCEEVNQRFFHGTSPRIAATLGISYKKQFLEEQLKFVLNQLINVQKQITPLNVGSNLLNLSASREMLGSKRKVPTQTSSASAPSEKSRRARFGA